jgi:hypothetical protein
LRIVERRKLFGAQQQIRSLRKRLPAPFGPTINYAKRFREALFFLSRPVFFGGKRFHD